MPIRNHRGTAGTAMVEFCLVLPILLVMVFAIVDLGNLVTARFIVTSISREGGDLAFRSIDSSTTDLITMLQNSSTPINLINSGKICITNITAGSSATNPQPVIGAQVCSGNLTVASSISANAPYLGLTPAIYNHLVCCNISGFADIIGVTVVETFYNYTPITPLPNLVQGIFLNNGSGEIIGSRAVYCTAQPGG